MIPAPPFVQARPSWRRCFVPVTVAIALTTAPLASAAPARGRTVRESLTGDARAAFEEGTSLFKRGRYADSRAAFERAVSLGGDVRVLFNVAVCEKELGHYARAVARLRESLARGGSDLPQSYREQVDDSIALFLPFVGQLVVDTSQPGALVYLDGQPLGRTPLASPIEVDVGAHLVAAREDGFVEASQQVDVPRNGITVHLVLAPARDASASAGSTPARLRLTTDDPASEIFVDGQKQGVGGYEGSIPAGAHQLEVMARGTSGYATSLKLAPGEVKVLRIQLPHRSEVPTWLWIVGGSVLAAAGATTAVLLLTRKTEYVGVPVSSTAMPSIGSASYPLARW
jgi:hypothetical protein